MKVIDAIKKYNLKESRMRIYDEKKQDEILGDKMHQYYQQDVVTIYTHNGDAVIKVKGLEN